MRNDPVDIRLRQLIWRRELTEGEQAELRAWLSTHPEAQLDWEIENQLSALLKRLPDVPVSSNFASRVLQAVERESSPPTPARQAGRAWWLRVFLPRLGVAALIGIVGLAAYHQYQVEQRKELRASLVAISKVEPLPSPEVLKDFEVIHRLSPTPAPDKELQELFASTQ